MYMCVHTCVEVYVLVCAFLYEVYIYMCVYAMLVCGVYAHVCLLVGGICTCVCACLCGCICTWVCMFV